MHIKHRQYVQSVREDLYSYRREQLLVDVREGIELFEHSQDTASRSSDQPDNHLLWNLLKSVALQVDAFGRSVVDSTLGIHSGPPPSKESLAAKLGFESIM